MKRLLALIAFLALFQSLGALENPGPELQRQRSTSTIKEISMKPLFLYAPRGRRDPFTFDLSGATAQGADRDFSISDLRLEGFIGEGEHRVALFTNGWKGTTYKFRAGKLYSETGALVADVSGDIVGLDRVHLLQGESSIIFNMMGSARMSALEDSRRHLKQEGQSSLGLQASEKKSMNGGQDAASEEGQDGGASSASQKGAP